MNSLAAREKDLSRRAAALEERLNAAMKKGITSADLDSIRAEFDMVRAAQKQVQRERADAGRFMDYGNAKGYGEVDKKMVNAAGSPACISETSWKGLWEATKNRLPSYRVEAPEVTTKAAFSESSFASGSLPPILLPQNSLELPYEPDRLLDNFKQQAAPEGPGVEWLQHTGNESPAAVVAELGTKPELGLQLTTHTATWKKIAALATISMEAASDFPTFQSFVPNELYRAIIDAETDYFTNDSSAGLLNQPGVLTREVGSDSNIDAIRKAANDIRVGSAFGTADLVAMHPTTWAAVSLAKSSTGQYLLNPDDPSAIGDLKSIFGMQVVQNTRIPAGSAMLFDTSKAVLRWVRWGFSIEINSMGSDGTTNMWAQNAVSYRGEIREQIGVQYPSAINILTGLPTS